MGEAVNNEIGPRGGEAIGLQKGSWYLTPSCYSCYTSILLNLRDASNVILGNFLPRVPLDPSDPFDIPSPRQPNAVVGEGLMSQPTRFASSSSIVAPLFQNQSCDPYTPAPNPCRIGNYVDYAVNVSAVEDVIAAINFAQAKNVRLVVKSTGHDLLGRSTGKGGLGIWTHYLKSISFPSYRSAYYNGPAAKMGAGIQAWEAYEAADSHGLRVLGGTCPTVGVVGGFTQGGGHSMLSSVNGLSADNVLEWEVVTAEGKHILATPTSNEELYWALSGGGASTYAVVVSMTVKAFADGVVSAAQVSFPSAKQPPNAFWKGIGAFHGSLQAWVDKGGMAAYTILNSFFFLQPVTFPGRSEAEVKTLMRPFLDELDALNITYAVNFTSFPTYLQHFSLYYGPLPYGIYPSAQVQGSRLIPRSVVQKNNSALTAALEKIAADGYEIVGVGLNVANSVGSEKRHTNAVLPAWRDTITHLIVASAWNFSIPWSQNVAKESEITNSVIPLLEAITPGSGAYMNEGDPNQPNWQQTFYGSNYDALRGVKRRYDPNDLFYATAAVGSEAWKVASDGRLCLSD